MKNHQGDYEEQETEMNISPSHGQSTKRRAELEENMKPEPAGDDVNRLKAAEQMIRTSDWEETRLEMTLFRKVPAADGG